MSGWKRNVVEVTDELGRVFQDSTAKRIVKRPIAAYVEKVYEEGDFADLGIGT